MPRKKSADPDKILTRVLRIRLTDAAFKRLEKISKSSDCHTVGEAARKILSKEKITLFYKDITLNSTMEELVEISEIVFSPFQTKLSSPFLPDSCLSIWNCNYPYPVRSASSN